MSRHPTRLVATIAKLALLTSVASCDKCKSGKETEPPIGVAAPPRVATQDEIGTELGRGRSVDTKGTEISTAMQWSRIVPLDGERFVIGGSVEGEACMVSSSDGARSYVVNCSKADAMMFNWSVGAEGVTVLTTARRQVPKKALPQGQKAPIDTINFYFAPMGEKLSAPAPLLAFDEKQATPLIMRGNGLAAVLGPSLASIAVELRPRTFALAYSAGPGEALPTPLELPAGEEPVAAPFGRPPQLLTVSKNRLWSRPWPKPGATLDAPKPVERVGVTKALIDELSEGAECEAGAWSFRRVQQPGLKTFLVGASPERTIAFELPSSVVNESPMACSVDRVVVEAVNPTDRLASLVVCTLDGVCMPPENRPFLKPWPEPHEREIAFALSTKGVVAVQSLKTKVKWGLFASESVDGGKLYNLERRFGGGEGTGDDGYDMGAMIGLGDRTLLLLTAKVTRSTRRNWYMLATDDSGLTWQPP